MADISSKQHEMGVLRHGEERKTERSDGSVLLDMEGLSLLAGTSANAPDATTEAAAAAAAASTNPAPALLHKTQSRKWSQRGDRTAAPEDRTPFNPAIAAADGGRGAAAAAATVALAPVAPPTDKFVAVVLSPTATSEAKANVSSPLRGPPPRRIHVRRSAATSPWLDPRRVLLSFAALSSMGTIILLYFTLSMDKMGGGDGNARW